MELSQKQIKKIASLVKLDLTEGELDKFGHQLTDILNYVEQLNELPTQEAEVKEVRHILAELREDEADGGRFQAKIVGLSPDENKEDSLFSVPAVLGEE